MAGEGYPQEDHSPEMVSKALVDTSPDEVVTSRFVDAHSPALSRAAIEKVVAADGSTHEVLKPGGRSIKLDARRIRG